MCTDERNGRTVHLSSTRACWNARWRSAPQSLTRMSNATRPARRRRRRRRQRRHILIPRPPGRRNFSRAHQVCRHVKTDPSNVVKNSLVFYSPFFFWPTLVPPLNPGPRLRFVSVPLTIYEYSPLRLDVCRRSCPKYVRQCFYGATGTILQKIIFYKSHLHSACARSRACTLFPRTLSGPDAVHMDTRRVCVLV